MEDWALIRRLAADGVPKAPIAEQLGISRTTICDWNDNHSGVCERGDFTKDRDERLALGAGNKYKHDAWSWIINNA